MMKHVPLLRVRNSREKLRNDKYRPVCFAHLCFAHHHVELSWKKQENMRKTCNVGRQLLIYISLSASRDICTLFRAQILARGNRGCLHTLKRFSNGGKYFFFFPARFEDRECVEFISKPDGRLSRYDESAREQISHCSLEYRFVLTISQPRFLRVGFLFFFSLSLKRDYARKTLFRTHGVVSGCQLLVSLTT